LLTGEPWLLLGYALGPTPTFVQAADLGGVHLLSFAVVLVNAALAEALRSWPDGRAFARALAPAVAALALLYAYGLYRLAMPLPGEPAVPLAVIQGNNDMGTQWQDDFYGRGLEEYLRMSVDAASDEHPALLVWPETAITFFLDSEPAYQ